MQLCLLFRTSTLVLLFWYRLVQHFTDISYKASRWFDC
uniref:Uncharacterized protein n=1 Tax=Arundo donax TaxID=35708 RepID=A0A0A9C8A5_ARUDO